ncbi:YdcF family protein [Paenibacillus sp. GP183]|uniref:YdcF family protein n=1 Tax=Paenibacillus sp. GP183 TaxID=1882751 RepID=UPI000894E763|nr:YdcF family protein [Paenibacillus sp. GP183]SEB59765.1 protein SanA, affects membrane permeability for vancomycin [Paenibacillus sp. GP183]
MKLAKARRDSRTVERRKGRYAWFDRSSRGTNKQAARSGKGSGTAVRGLSIMYRGLLLLIFLSIIWVVYIQWQVQSTPHSPLPASADTGIVLGASLRNDIPSPGLQERLDLALKLYHEGKFKHIIVTGGLDHNGSKLTEAEGMRLYLIKQGIPNSVIVLEPEATSTYQNLLYSKHIMDKSGWKSAIIMTHNFHGARSLDIAHTVGIKQPAIATTGSQVLFMPYHEARETLAYTKWQIDKLLLQLGLMNSL